MKTLLVHVLLRVTKPSGHVFTQLIPEVRSNVHTSPLISQLLNSQWPYLRNLFTRAAELLIAETVSVNWMWYIAAWSLGASCRYAQRMLAAQNLIVSRINPSVFLTSKSF
jgi:hypothetical protein